MHVLHRDPRSVGVQQTRWRLADVRAQFPLWRLRSNGSLSHLLKRLRISYKRARAHVHSPDPAYQAKLEVIEQRDSQVRASSGEEVLLYLDECSYERQPEVARTYEQQGDVQALAERSHQSNTLTRLVGTLDAHSGQVQALSASKIGLPKLVSFYQQVVAAYPEAQRIWVVQDNWPVHFHPDVLVALEPQLSPFPFPQPPNWPREPSAAACKRWGELHLPIQLVTLPTYASWCNPIEKLWRMLRQDVLYVHRHADDLEGLRKLVMDFLGQFASGSMSLLHYVGLAPDYIPFNW